MRRLLTQVISVDGRSIRVLNPQKLKRAHSTFRAVDFWLSQDELQVPCSLCDANIPFGFGKFMFPEDRIVCDTCFDAKQFQIQQPRGKKVLACKFEQSIEDVLRLLFDKWDFSVEEIRTRAAYVKAHERTSEKKRIPETTWREVQDAIVHGFTRLSMWRGALAVASFDVYAPDGSYSTEPQTLQCARVSLFREGYLRKDGAKSMTRFRARWFALDEEALCYYDRKERDGDVWQDELKGRIPLESIQKVSMEMIGKQMVLSVQKDERVYHFLHKEDTELTSWRYDIASMCLYHHLLHPPGRPGVLRGADLKRIRELVDMGATVNVGLYARRSIPPLLAAFEADDYECGTLLWSLGADPACFAARKVVKDADSLLKVVHFLLQVTGSSMDFIGIDDDRKTLLHYACEYNCKEVVDHIMSACPKLTGRVCGEYGRTPLHLALLFGHYDLLLDLLPRVQSPNHVNISDSTGDTLIHIAAKSGQLKLVDALLNTTGLELDAQDGSGKTALHYAIAAGCVPVIHRLLEAGIDVAVQDCFGDTAIHFLLRIIHLHISLANDGSASEEDKHRHDELMENRIDVLEKMLSQGSGKLAVQLVQVENQNSCCHIAVRCDLPDMLGVMVKFDPKAVFAVDVDGNSPLHAALLNERHECADVLLEVDELPLTLINKDHSTPAHIAVELGQNEFLGKILEKCPDVSIWDENGNSPVHLACEMSDWRSLKVMVDFKCDLSMTNEKGFSPLHISVVQADVKCAKILIDYGVPMSSPTPKRRRTPLHLAAEDRFRHSCGILLLDSKKVNVNAEDFRGCTPLHVAYACANMEFALVLEAYGSSKNRMSFHGLLPRDVMDVGLGRLEESPDVPTFTYVGPDFPLHPDVVTTGDDLGLFVYDEGDMSAVALMDDDYDDERPLVGSGLRRAFSMHGRRTEKRVKMSERKHGPRRSTSIADAPDEGAKPRGPKYVSSSLESVVDSHSQLN